MFSPIRCPIILQLSHFHVKPYRPIKFVCQHLFWRIPYRKLPSKLSCFSIRFICMCKFLVIFILYSSSYLRILEYFFAAVIRTVSSCFVNFAFPPHTCPAHSHLGKITLMRIHFSFLVSRCGSGERTCSVLALVVSPLTKPPFQDGTRLLILVETPPTFGRSLRVFHISQGFVCPYSIPVLLHLLWPPSIFWESDRFLATL